MARRPVVCLHLPGWLGENGISPRCAAGQRRQGEGNQRRRRQIPEGRRGQSGLFLASELTAADTDSKLRKAIKTALDLDAIGKPAPRMRRDAVIKLGQEQNPEYLPYFQKRLEIEKDQEVTKALNEAVALTQTMSTDPAVRNAAIQKLGDMRSINALEFLKKLQKQVNAAPSKYRQGSRSHSSHGHQSDRNAYWWINMFGTAFRGLSVAAVLLVAALGLAITFGLMGVINMAHGEVMAVGSYTAYMVQGIFGSGLLMSLFGKTLSIKGFGLSGAGI